MTYILNPSIGKIESPVILVFPDGKRRSYQNGTALVDDVFDQKYVVESFRSIDSIIEIEIKESDLLDGQESFF